MKITEKLQHIIQSSEFLKTVQEIKNYLKLIDSQCRGLTDAEINLLEKNRNSAEDWGLVSVQNGFSPEFISGNRFYGKCMLGVFTGVKREVQDGALIPSGIYDSVIINSVIDSESLVFQCSLISNYFIKEKAVIYNTGSITASGNCTFGHELVIPVGPETGEMPLPLFAEMDMDTAVLLLESADRPGLFSDYIAMYRTSVALDCGFIGRSAVITDTTSINDTYIGEGASIRGAMLIEGSTILSSPEEGTYIGGGVKIKSSMIQHGCEINSMSVIFNSLIMEHAEGENQCRISSSVIGPNSSLGGGEVTSTVAGPFTVSHHQSLLIAAIWPGGRGNIGYGANVGSNHTSRLPDQEIHPGEGMFFGLGCSIKFPADYRRAPYSIVATGTVTQPQRVEFPFSLITPPSSPDKGLPLHLNELFPAWALSENIYAVLRNESKYRARNKSRRNAFDFTILRPVVIDMILSARERLMNAADKSCHTEKDIPGTGKNFITDESRIKGIETYTFYIRHYALTAMHGRIEEIVASGSRPSIDMLMLAEGTGYWNHAANIFKGEKLSDRPLRENLEALVISLEKIYSDAFESRKKDYTRGVKIIDNYSQYHKSPENDLSLSDMRRSTEAKIARIKEIILKI